MGVLGLRSTSKDMERRGHADFGEVITVVALQMA